MGFVLAGVRVPSPAPTTFFSRPYVFETVSFKDLFLATNAAIHNTKGNITATVMLAGNSGILLEEPAEFDEFGEEEDVPDVWVVGVGEGEAEREVDS